MRNVTCSFCGKPGEPRDGDERVVPRLLRDAARGRRIEQDKAKSCACSSACFAAAWLHSTSVPMGC